jgi:predicted HicB family RNase H-like nuclease
MKNQTVKHKSYEGSVEVDLEDGCLHGQVLFIRDRIVYEGATVLELEECFREAVDDYLETCEELGKEPERACSGQFQVRISPETHRELIRAACQTGTSMNQFVQLAIDEKLTRQNEIRHVHEHRLTVHIAEQYSTSDSAQDSNEWVPNKAAANCH